MNRIAIIPARSGSKGLKNKNIIDLGGKPLMAYSIEAAKESGLFDHIIVSTDSIKYGEIAIKYGAEVIYRDEKTANDLATTFMVIEDLFGKIKYCFDYFVLLQPTSPFRNSNHIKEACSLFEENISSFDFLVSMKIAEHGSILVKPIEEDLSLKHFDVDFSNYRRQSYKEYSPNGAIFIGKPNQYLKKKHFFGDKSIAYIMSKNDSIDIDDRVDYLMAVAYLQEKGDINE